MEKENRITPSFISVPGGPVLGLTDTPLLDVDGLKFKDLERCGELLPYEDWRLTAGAFIAGYAVSGNLRKEEFSGVRRGSLGNQRSAS